jgi:hypothetical protein
MGARIRAAQHASRLGRIIISGTVTLSLRSKPRECHLLDASMGARIRAAQHASRLGRIVICAVTVLTIGGLFFALHQEMG